MTNTYRVTGPVDVHDHEPGTEFEQDLTADDERDLLEGGRIAIVPRRYLVVGTSRVNGTDPGDTFLGAFSVAQEAALIEGGHIERADLRPPAGRPPKPAPEPPAPADKKE